MAVSSASPERNAPPSGGLESSSSNPMLTSEIVSDSASASDHSDRFDRCQSLPGEGDLVSSAKSEEYRLLFRLPPEEVLIQDFNCALQESILLQGHMYLFDRHLCFYSNIFGFETKKIILLHEVTSIRRAKTAGLFSNAIEIEAGGRKHFFASFLSRDEAFKLITERVSQCSNGTSEIVIQQDFKSETSDQMSKTISTEEERSRELLVGDMDCDLSQDTSKMSNKKLPQSKDDDSRASTSEVLDAVEEEQKVVSNANVPTHLSSVKWEEESQAFPGVPKHYTKVAESKFPIKVEEFFNLFFSDEAFSFLESYRKRCGDKDFECSRWSPHETFGHARDMSFQHPIKIYFGAKCGGCKELQTFRIYKNSHLVIQTSQEVSDVPYADYFKVEGLWDVERVGDGSKESCVLRVYVNLNFTKKTIWKGKIEQSTIEECRDAFNIWIDLAHEVLKNKNIEKPEEGRTHINKKSSGRIAEPSEESYKSRRLMDVPSGCQDSHQQTNIPIQEKIFDIATTMSFVRAILVKLCSSLKNPSNLQRVLLILFAVIIVLMQVSIVVLLSRPHHVYVIPQSGPGLATGAGGTHKEGERIIGWLEKRVDVLKDEMLVVEAQLERMRREQVMLKTQLENLKSSV